MNFVKSFDFFGVPARQVPSITGTGAPTTATEGAVGCLYMDTDTGNLYKCTAASGGVYTWVKSESSGGGISDAAKDLLITILRNGVYSTDQSANITALENALAAGGDGDPDEPVTPTVTLTNISATYSGGDVAAGTVVSDLTGIVVTAHYSDGSSATVTGYTLSGEIVEGENTVTVTYGGKTATFTVTGVTESSGDDVENNGWTSGEAYAIEWTDGYSLDSSGVESEYTSLSVSSFLPCQNVSRMVTSNLKSNYQLWYYDANKNFLRRAPVSYVVNQTNIETYRDAYYVRTTKNLATTNASVIPYLDDLLGANTTWEAGKYYRLNWTDGVSINSTGADSADVSSASSDFALCYGAASLQFSNAARSFITWYDADKQFISQETRQNNTAAVTIPDGAFYFRLHTATVVGANFWVQLS